MTKTLITLIGPIKPARFHCCWQLYIGRMKSRKSWCKVRCLHSLISDSSICSARTSTFIRAYWMDCLSSENRMLRFHKPLSFALPFCSPNYVLSSAYCSKYLAPNRASSNFVLILTVSLSLIISSDLIFIEHGVMFSRESVHGRCRCCYYTLQRQTNYITIYVRCDIFHLAWKPSNP